MMRRHSQACLFGLLLACASAEAREPRPPASLDQAAVTASQESSTLLRVAVPGRYTLAAHSAAGASLQLVDMLAGPGEPAGIPGTQDGRIDALLDAGTYKLRIVPADHASGAVALSVTASTDAAPPAEMPAAGTLSAELADGQQRRFWLAVPADGRLRVAATGRALADLRVWRDGRDLVPMLPAARAVEPVRGHPMTTLLLAGNVEPGTYLVAAYGGVAAPWADASRAAPFYLRASASAALAIDWAAGIIGPSGTEVFSVPRWAASLRLDLPSVAATSLVTEDGATASIDAHAREPWTLLGLPAAKSPAIVELRGAAGQPYRLRVIGRTGPTTFGTPGDWWVSADTLGMGGDEVPPGLVLVRHEAQGPVRILADTVPHVGPGAAWRARFNLRGPSALIVQADRGGALALHTDGVALDRSVVPQSASDVAADLLTLSLVPAAGAFGALDVTLGPPGMPAGLAMPFPADPVVSFGMQTLVAGQSLELYGPRAPGVEMGLSARKVPVALADAPLVLTQLPGQVLHVPVLLPVRARLSASVVGQAGALAVTARPDGQASVVDVPASTSLRLVVLAPDMPASPPPVSKPRALTAVPRLQVGQPVFLDLAADASRSFALHVDQGGLYQVETLGRMRTEGQLGTSFIAELATARANGAGQNMRLLPWLRAGDYRVTVTARDSAGHLGVQAVQAPLQPCQTLLPGASVRATLEAGMGLEVPIDVAQAGRYRIALLGQGGGFSARLDDAEGWPLTIPGPFDAREQDLRPGRYRLLVTPGTTRRRVVVAMQRIEPPRVIAGHGPHPLALAENVSATWREPQAAGAARTPDSYVFHLAGVAHVHVRLGAGMSGVLSGPRNEEPQNERPGNKVPRSAAPVTKGPESDGGGSKKTRLGESWDGVLEAGQWRLEVSAQGRDDRLDYTLQVDADELQPERERDVALPSSSSFTIATERVVTLTTVGTAPVRAILRDAGGVILARAGARDNDWNTAVSQRLPAGSYTLDLSPGTPPASTSVAADTRPRYPGAAGEASTTREEDTGKTAADTADARPDDAEQAGTADKPDAEPGNADQGQANANGPDQGDGDQNRGAGAPDNQPDGNQSDAEPGQVPADSGVQAPADSGTEQADQTAPSVTDTSDSGNSGAEATIDTGLRTRVTLHLPPDLPAAPAPARLATLTGAGVHVLTIASPPPGTLLVAAASGAGTAVLALERQDGAGSWRQVAQASGAAPFAAVLADGAAAPWRATLWSLDGGAAPLAVAVQAVDTAPTNIATKLDGPDVAVAQITLHAPLVARVSGPPGLLQASWPGHAAVPLDDGQAVPQGNVLWLVSRLAGPVAAVPLDVEPARSGHAEAGPLTLDIAAGARAMLPVAAARSGRLRVWRADAGTGQPAWVGGGVVASRSAVLHDAHSLVLEDASRGADAMRVQVTAIDLVALPARQLAGPLSVRLGRRQAMPVHVPADGGDLSVSLTPGMAAFVTGPDGERGVWAPTIPVSRVVPSGAELLLANLGQGTGYAGVSPVPHVGPDRLTPGQRVARFHGAAGSLDIAADVPEGGRIAVAGEASLLVRDAAGRVWTGTAASPAPGPAQVTMTYAPGASVLWLQSPGRSPWPDAVPTPVKLPGMLALGGAAVVVRVAGDGPMLLHAVTTSPVLLVVGGAEPELFAAGAEFHRAVPGGVTLRILPAHDGPLSGSLALWSEALRPAPEGLGLTVMVPPGGSAAFTFALPHPARVGLGVRADPDSASVRLLDQSGTLLGEGVAQLRDLPAGRYVIEARVPADAPATVLRPALLGTRPGPAGPPADVAAGYLELVGLKPGTGTP